MFLVQKIDSALVKYDISEIKILLSIHFFRRLNVRRLY